MKRILIIIGVVVVGIALIVCGCFIAEQQKTKTPAGKEIQWSELY